jgi:hypothetical protein
MKHSSGWNYNGEWKNGKFDGFGRLTIENG